MLTRRCLPCSYPSLNFALGETIDMLRDQVQSFVAAEIAPRAAQIDHDNLFPADLWRKFGDMGLLGITVPEEYGGAGLGYLAHVVAMEEISRGSASVALSYGATPTCASTRSTATATHETQIPAQADQRRTHRRPGHERAERRLRRGVDETARRQARRPLRAQRQQDLDHQRPDANTYVIYAKTDLEKGAGITAFIVERDWKGFSRSNKFDKLGMRGSNTCELFFDDVEVPEENILGVLNGGVKVLMSGLDYERVVLSGGPTGIMQAAWT
jgi:isovaleryl-CoA dehydrogenase